MGDTAEIRYSGSNVKVTYSSQGDLTPATKYFARSAVTQIVFAGYAGNDEFINHTRIASEALGGAGNDYLQGGWNHDTILGGSGDDTLYGGGGDDQLRGNTGGDTYLYGNTRSGTFLSKGSNQGYDQIYDGAGYNTLDFRGFAQKVTINLSNTGKQTVSPGKLDLKLNSVGAIDRVFGSRHNDMIFGNYLDNYLHGGHGNDIICGRRGNDTLYGSDGDDSLRGQYGDNHLYGQAGHDTLRGGGRNDVLWGGSGNDNLKGGRGHDTLRGGDGDDYLHGQYGDDHLYGEAGQDTLRGGSHNDMLYGGSGNDNLNGYKGRDRLYGGDGDDFLHGHYGDDHLYGHAGQDTLKGGSHNDVLYGGSGNDKLYGYKGRDTLCGNGGDDSLHGQDGADFIYGNDGSDLLFGQLGDDTLHGGAGDDRLYSGLGVDYLCGGPGADTLVSIDGDWNDTLYGESGADSFWIDTADAWLTHNVDWVTNNADNVADESDFEADYNLHAVETFLNGADKTLDGDNLADPTLLDPTPGTHYKSFSHRPLFASSGPSERDVGQGPLGDCWLLATLGSAAMTNPNSIRQTVCDLGDGTYAVQLGSGYYRVDADLPTSSASSTTLLYAGLGEGNCIWVPIVEKASAYHWTSTGPATYMSLHGGFATNAFNAIGCTGLATTRSPSSFFGTHLGMAKYRTTATAALNHIAGELNQGKAVVVNIDTPSAGSPLVGPHSYIVERIIYDSRGDPVWVRLRNPWGVDGPVVQGFNDGLVTISGQQLVDSMFSDDGIQSAWVH